MTSARRRVFEGPSSAARDPMLRAYLSDMVAPYPATLREDLLSAGRGQSYGEMAGALIADLSAPGGPVSEAEPVDLIVLAFAVPDVIPGRSTAAHLSHLCPGAPMAFAICDQGVAAAFTGLCLIREYTRAGDCRRALLVIAEQGDLHTSLAAPAPVPARHAAVALLCGGEGPGRLGTVSQRAGVTPGQAGEIVAAEVAGLTGDGPVTLITGAGLAPIWPGSPPRGSPPGGLPPAGGPGGPAGYTAAAAPAGQPLTGPWWRLAGELPTWGSEDRRFVLADYDPVLAYLCTAVIEVGSPAGAGQISRSCAAGDGEAGQRHVSRPAVPADHGTLSG